MNAPAETINTGALLSWGAAILVCGCVYVNDTDLHTAHPWMLLPACIWLLWPAKTIPVLQVQTAVFLYLMWIIWAAAFNSFWTYSCPWGPTLRISNTLPAAVLIWTGYWLCRSGADSLRPGFCFNGWTLAVSVTLIVVHAGGLLILWRQCYGFGWEEDMKVLSRISLCTIVVMGMVPVERVYVLRSTLTAMLLLLLLVRSLA